MVKTSNIIHETYIVSRKFLPAKKYLSGIKLRTDPYRDSKKCRIVLVNRVNSREAQRKSRDGEKVRCYPGQPLAKSRTNN